MDQRGPVFHWKIFLGAWNNRGRPQCSEAIPKYQRKYCKGVQKGYEMQLHEAKKRNPEPSTSIERVDDLCF